MISPLVARQLLKSEREVKDRGAQLLAVTGGDLQAAFGSSAYLRRVFYRQHLSATNAPITAATAA